MFSFFRKNKLTSTESVDIIQKISYDYLKQFGFQKHGRTLHRFVDGDISQVIQFQNGCPSKGVFNVFWVNLGIRVPESFERKFTLSDPLKKYYHEYECNIRSSLGPNLNDSDSVYSLKKDPEKIGDDVLDKIIQHVLPVYDVLNCRQSILEHRREYPRFDEHSNHLITLEEAMIYGRKGDISTAEKLFNTYYQECLAEYNHDLEHGSQMFLCNGHSVTYHNAQTNQTETIKADKTGYITVFHAIRGHLDYLQELAKELNLKIY